MICLPGPRCVNIDVDIVITWVWSVAKDVSHLDDYWDWEILVGQLGSRSQPSRWEGILYRFCSNLIHDGTAIMNFLTQMSWWFIYTCYRFSAIVSVNSLFCNSYNHWWFSACQVANFCRLNRKQCWCLSWSRHTLFPKLLCLGSAG